MVLTTAMLMALATFALAAGSAAPGEFGGVTLGASLHEMKSHYPDASRNPDSDRQYQVYQVAALHGASIKSPGAFQIYQGRVVGGQILLDTHNAQYWFDAMAARYGQPDSCKFCGDAELTTAVWHWENGTTLKIEGEMLTEITREGAEQRSAWMARASSDNELADNGDELSDEGEAHGAAGTTSHKHRQIGGHAASSATSPENHPQRPAGWRGYYDNMNSRLEHWLGWSK